MELVPIIYQILIISGGVFIIVLAVSYIASRISPNNQAIKNGRTIIPPRIVYTKVYPMSRFSNYHNYDNRARYGNEEYRYGDSNVKEVRVIRSSQQPLKNYRLTRDTVKTNHRFDNKRYSIVNDLMTDTDKPKPKKKQVFYKIDFSQSA